MVAGEMPVLMAKPAVELVPWLQEARNLAAPGRQASQMREDCRTAMKDQAGLVVGAEQFDQGQQFAPVFSMQEPLHTLDI